MSYYTNRVNLQNAVLRRFLETDKHDLVKNINNINIASRGRIPHPYTINDAEIYLSKVLPGYSLLEPQQVVFAIVLSEEVVGSVSIEKQDQDSGIIGYWLAEQHWGKGIATQAAKAAINTAFTDMNLMKIVGRALVNNQPSHRVMLKLGFKYTGRDVETIRSGEQREVWLFELLRPKF
jgi:RimJ/RimL family protein N-acetyltransferase